MSTISRAYRVAADAHQSQMRSSGESYINHPLAVAQIVADIGLDEVSVTAALLHDAVEDTEITVADVERDFGSEVAAIVDGVTKLERIRFDSREEQQAATMRKMLVAMAKDLRVLVIKLADRLHNMRTIAAMPPEKQQRIAQETLDIYAPLAHRLGMQEMKQQLEDLAFASLHPKRFAELDHLVSSRTPERDVYLAKTLAEVRSRLDELGIKAEVTGRGKHLWSIYEKMVVKGREFDEIFDLIAIRVVVPTDEGLLRGARLDPRPVAPGRGAVQGLHRDAQVQPLPELAHDGDRPGRQADRGADPHRPRCTSEPSGASPRTGRTRRAPRSRPRSTG